MTGKKQKVSSREFAIQAGLIAKERNCKDIVLLDLSGKSPATDYFVIATGTSDRQMKTVADEILDMAKENNCKRFGSAGYDHGRWILLDYVDVIIHIFDEEYREYYDLELLWGDAKKIELDDV